MLPLEPDHTLSLPTAFLTYPDRPCSTPRLLGSPARLTCSTRLLDSTLLACVLGSPARLVRATPRASCSRLRCLTCSARLCLSYCVCLPHVHLLRALSSPTCSPARSPRLEHHSAGLSWRLSRPSLSLAFGARIPRGVDWFISWGYAGGPPLLKRTSSNPLHVVDRQRTAS